jgi:hypothetical protein
MKFSALSYTLRAGLAALCLVAAAGCASFDSLLGREPKEPYVTLAWQDRAGRMVILISDLKIPVSIQPPDAMPYSGNASAAVWVGEEFPYDKAIQILKWARNYYKELRYLALSDYASPGRGSVRKELFIGGSTETAVEKLSLRAWTDADWRKLDSVNSQEAFHALIRAKYPAQ